MSPSKAKTKTGSRSHDLGGRRYVLGASCQTCGTPWTVHLRCGACGTALGPGHETPTVEPYGAHPVCDGCRQHLGRRRLRIRKPAVGNQAAVLAEAGDAPLARKVDAAIIRMTADAGTEDGDR